MSLHDEGPGLESVKLNELSCCVSYKCYKMVLHVLFTVCLLALALGRKGSMSRLKLFIILQQGSSIIWSPPRTLGREPSQNGIGIKCDGFLVVKDCMDTSDDTTGAVQLLGLLHKECSWQEGVSLRLV